MSIVNWLSSHRTHFRSADLRSMVAQNTCRNRPTIRTWRQWSNKLPPFSQMTRKLSSKWKWCLSACHWCWSPGRQPPCIWMAAWLPFRTPNSGKFHRRLWKREHFMEVIYIGRWWQWGWERWRLLFNTTIDAIVAQKNTPGQSAELTIAKATVTINTITSMMMLHTIRGVKLPLKCAKP